MGKEAFHRFCEILRTALPFALRQPVAAVTTFPFQEKGVFHVNSFRESESFSISHFFFLHYKTSIN